MEQTSIKRQKLKSRNHNSRVNCLIRRKTLCCATKPIILVITEIIHGCQNNPNDKRNGNPNSLYLL